MGAKIYWCKKGEDGKLSLVTNSEVDSFSDDMVYSGKGDQVGGFDISEMAVGMIVPCHISDDICPVTLSGLRGKDPVYYRGYQALSNCRSMSYEGMNQMSSGHYNLEPETRQCLWDLIDINGMQFDQRMVRPLFCLPLDIEKGIKNFRDSHTEYLPFFGLLNKKIRENITKSLEQQEKNERKLNWVVDSVQNKLCINALHECFRKLLTPGLVHARREGVTGRISEIIPVGQAPIYRNPYDIILDRDTIVNYELGMRETIDAVDVMRTRYVLLYDSDYSSLFRGFVTEEVYGKYVVFFKTILAAYFSVKIESVQTLLRDEGNMKIRYTVDFRPGVQFKIEIRGFLSESFLRNSRLGNRPWTISNLDEQMLVRL